MVSGELAGECVQTGFDRHRLARQRAPQDTVYPLRSEEPKRVVSKRVVLADVPPERTPERGYVRMFPRNEKQERGYVRMFPRNNNRNERTFAKNICCEVIIWAKFGHFRCYYLGQVGVIIWAKLFLAYKNSGFKRFFAHTVII